jgi:tetratricopeptide (TPR) repeat protein
MRSPMITTLLCFLFASSLNGQTKDAVEVKQITYEQGLNKGKIVRVSKQQMMAKPDYDKGYSFAGNHEFKKAIKFLKRAIRIDSTGNCGTGTNGIAYNELGYSYSRSGDFDSAAVYLDKAIELDKFNPEPYLSKSAILTQQDKSELALKVLDSLIKYNPDYALAYAQKGFLYRSTKQYEPALQNFKAFLGMIEKQNQQQNSKAMVEDVQKQIRELEQKTKK